MLAFEPPSIWKRMRMGGGGAEGEGCAKKGKRAADARAAAEAGMEGRQWPTAAAEWEMGDDAEAKAVEQSGPSVAPASSSASIHSSSVGSVPRSDVSMEA
eukprot:scaffold52377_cov281-Isochrysis_galbana.AAC.1